MILKIEAKGRELGKKSDLKNLRKSGMIPGVLYTKGQKGKNIVLKESKFLKILRESYGNVAFFDVEFEGKTYRTIIKEKQMHPVSRRFVHVDFNEIEAGKPIHLMIPLTYVGVPKGVDKGGRLEVLLRSLEVICLMKDAPEDIKIDVSDLGLNEGIHLRDIALENMETNVKMDQGLAIVHKPRGSSLDEEEAEEGTEEESAE